MLVSINTNLFTNLFVCMHHVYKPINTYISIVEDQNFALFNYVNELNNEIEFVQEQIQEV